MAKREMAKEIVKVKNKFIVSELRNGWDNSHYNINYTYQTFDTYKEAEKELKERYVTDKRYVYGILQVLAKGRTYSKLVTKKGEKPKPYLAFYFEYYARVGYYLGLVYGFDKEEGKEKIAKALKIDKDTLSLYTLTIEGKLTPRNIHNIKNWIDNKREFYDNIDWNKLGKKELQPRLDKVVRKVALKPILLGEKIENL